MLVQSIQLLLLINLINYSQSTFFDQFIPHDRSTEKWFSYKKIFNKLYKSRNENHFRRKIFQQNFGFINKLNQDYANGYISFRTELNDFADLTTSEFLRFKTGLIVQKNDSFAKRAPTIRHKREIALPTYKDWRTSGKVSPVQDQGKCGSCYAFSTVANCESFKAIRDNRMPIYSVQELIDCSIEDKSANRHCRGCGGGSLSCGFEYVKNNGLNDKTHKTSVSNSNHVSLKIPAESIFQNYRGIEGTCKKSDSKNEQALINDYALYYMDASVEDIQFWLYYYGPISIGINAELRSFQFYKGGIYDDLRCGRNLNHAVLLVGYGTENGTDYWIIKNSWSPSWGENGFMRIAKGLNICGMEDYGAFAFN